MRRLSGPPSKVKDRRDVSGSPSIETLEKKTTKPQIFKRASAPFVSWVIFLKRQGLPSWFLKEKAKHLLTHSVFARLNLLEV